MQLTNNASTRDERRRAGLLHAGPGAVITGLDALALHGMERIPAPHGPVHMLVPPDRRIAGHGLVVAERTHRLPDPVPGRWPVAPLDRAILDYTRRLRDRDLVRSSIAEVVQRRRCTPAMLWAELLAGCTRGRALPREVLEEISDGVRSVAEAKARVLVRGSGLPQPLWNPRLVDDETGQLIAVPDAWFDAAGVAWEIDSYEFHLSPQDYEKTLRRRRALTARGVVVVPHTPSQLTSDGKEVVGDLYAHVSRATAAGTRAALKIRAIPAPALRPTSGTLVR
ncbi:MAG: hypothetical protein L0H84_00340 [Pseudonocardia sp.]|nr:hypothetical protein [Pseudonocardia sp.]